MNDLDIEELPPVPAASLLASIDAEQDQLLIELDLLNARLESVLRDCAPTTVLEHQGSLPIKKAA